MCPVSGRTISAVEVREASAAIRCACDGGVSRSFSPAITSVGTVSRGSAWWSSISDIAIPMLGARVGRAGDSIRS